jgi:hypothetical protein
MAFFYLYPEVEVRTCDMIIMKKKLSQKGNTMDNSESIPSKLDDSPGANDVMQESKNIVDGDSEKERKKRFYLAILKYFVFISIIMQLFGRQIYLFLVEGPVVSDIILDVLQGSDIFGFVILTLLINTVPHIIASIYISSKYYPEKKVSTAIQVFVTIFVTNFILNRILKLFDFVNNKF